MRVTRETWILAAICLVDLITTLWFVRHGGASEGNPVMNFYLQQGVLPFVVAKCVLFLGPLLVLEWARRRNPRFVLTMLRVGIALYLGLYGAVVWRINTGDAAREVAEAQIAAVQRWAALPPTREEIALLRAQVMSTAR